MRRPAFSPAAAVAWYLRCDVEEVRAARYQPTRTPCHIFAFGEEYYTATRTLKPPPEPKGRDAIHFGEWRWRAVESGAHGVIWQHVDKG